MDYYSVLSNKYQKDIDRIRRQNANLAILNDDRIAVIVQSDHTAVLGIQFWTEEMIQQGESKNTDKTMSFFIDRL